jgi:hypothetical protein
VDSLSAAKDIHIRFVQQNLSCQWNLFPPKNRNGLSGSLNGIHGCFSNGALAGCGCGRNTSRAKKAKQSIS